MSVREAKRLHLLGLVLGGRLTLVEAASRMGLSYRQAKRWKRRLAEEGPEGLIHGNRGRCPPNRVTDGVRQAILDLAQSKYGAFNDTHFCEMLAKNERIEVNRETVRQVLRGAGLAPKRKRKPRRHYRRRPRKQQEGMMMLWDGSPHRWFGSDQSPCCLMAAMDDATSRLLAGRFLDQESSLGYMLLLRSVVRENGIPISVYQDRHSALRRNDDSWSLEEQMAGKRDPTQVGAALEALDIQPIYALTPQAKGRVERLFNTLQDRLMAEMTLEGISGPQEANLFLEEEFIARHNERFSVPPERAQRAYRKVRRGMDLDRIISFRYSATVGNDNVVRLGGITIDVPPGPARRTYARARVEVRQLLDGSWRVYYQNRLIAKHAQTELREPRKIKGQKKRSLKGVQESLWIYLASSSN